MVTMFQEPLAAESVKEKARELGADLVGIADAAELNAHPPDPDHPKRPMDISDYDADRVIVLAKRLSAGTTKLTRWDERHKFYNDELALTAIEAVSLELVLWLEDRGYPALIVPPTHVDPLDYRGDARAALGPILSLPHAAVEAGLGTLGLNQMLLTPEYGPRVILTAVLTSAPLECDRRREEALCLGASECGRCLSACPGDVIGHFDRDWEACQTYRSPHGFHALADHIGRIIDEPDPAKKKAMLRSKDQFYLWQSILRGAGVVTGCRRCQDVCPVGDDYHRLADALAEIPEDTPEKQARLAEMADAEVAGDLPESYQSAERWIGALRPRGDVK
ncbi:4Fe-4S double cluster binding domain-containing protein [Amorphus orientalis]|uniref:Epoxyqueuosine reductase QueG n=1 Tax=Amorphus orientalis TaxID=649198 RepID=A0AAE3VMH2_9HYPH|nr:4Fe-4S double cluster binding domain-containing protein [Amorphus orientalis]MDQ0314762.1 epoxyqueuosine reductase QueG [Amorphus orientalis]